MTIIEKIKKIQVSTKVILLLGILSRFIAGVMANPAVFQHDVTQKNGHLDYAMYIMRNWRLANKNVYEFAQPPINAFMQALVMKFNTLFINYKSNYNLYATTKVLNIIYAILTFYVIYKIIEEFGLTTKCKNFILFIFAIYPSLIIMTTQFSNDGISYLFFYLSLYLGIRWVKNKNIKTIILLALSIGIGMLCKISVGLIAFILGPMMAFVLFRSIKENNFKNILIQLIVFSIIVFPIGLSYSIRNYIKFNQGFGEIFEIAKNTKMDMTKYSYTVFDRFLSFPIKRLWTQEYTQTNGVLTATNKNFGIFHDYIEYNIWVDLIKTATFDEFDFSKIIPYILKPFFILIYILNIIFHLVGVYTIFYNIYIVTKSIIKKSFDIKNPIFNMQILSIMIFMLSIFAYVSFNYKYQYSCNSNYRYVAYMTLAFSFSITTWRISKAQCSRS